MSRFRWPYALLTIAYCAVIFVLSAQPSLPDRAPPWLDWPGSDKIGHVVIYAGLALLIHAGLTQSKAPPSPRVRVVVPILFATLYGLSDELHQHFVPNRSLDPLDLLADIAGATIMVAALELWRRRRTPAGGTLRP